MPRRILKLTSFDSVSLDSTDVKCMGVEASGPTIRDSYYLTVSGEWFDANGDSDATTVPGTISGLFRVKGTSQANFDANTSGILDLVGVVGTLQGEDAAGNTYNCTARCVSVPYTHKPGAHTALYQDLKLEWRQKTEFS